MNFIQRIGFSSTLLFAVFSFSAQAAPFFDNQFVTYDQNTWGGVASNFPPPATPAFVLTEKFDTVYPNTMIVGIPTGYFLQFTVADSLLSYLPASGTAGILNANLVDSFQSSAGIFGGQVVSLRLNIDFNDAGITQHPSDITFGDLILTNNIDDLTSLNGLTVRQVYNFESTALGGGATGYNYSELSTLAGNLNAAFEGGFVSAFAETHLLLPDTGTTPTSAVPEPSEWSMLIAGFGLMGGVLRRTKVRFRSRAAADQVRSPDRLPCSVDAEG